MATETSFVKTVTLPAATYAFPLAYLTPADLVKPDRLKLQDMQVSNGTAYLHANVRVV